MTNPLERARRALAAAMHADDLELAAFYTAHARLQLAKAKSDLKELALMLTEREAELLRRASPKVQTSIGEGRS